MLRRSSLRRWQGAPSVYPFRKPFYDTPYDEDRWTLKRHNKDLSPNSYPDWMDKGTTGTGNGIGLNRTHPLSKLKGNVSRDASEIPRMFAMMTQGVRHTSGLRLYRRAGGKAPNPSTQPYLTGEPCPVYGWKVLDEAVTRKFEAPHIADRNKYKPYVGMQERQILGDLGAEPAPSKSVAKTEPQIDKPAPSKPLLKRLFFWK